MPAACFVWKALKFASPEAADGVGMVVLQLLRACTVITLGTVCASCWVLIIKVDKERVYFVFECASLFFTSVISIILILSEFPLVKPVRNYFRSAWPVLSDQHGLVWLGLAMLMLGCNIFGNLNKAAYDTDNLGPHFSKLVLAAGILSIAFGVFNIICSFAWRDPNLGLTARHVRTNGSLARQRLQSLPEYMSSYSGSIKEKAKGGIFSAIIGRAKKETGEKASHRRPKISDPIPTYQDVEHNAGHGNRVSPIAPDIQRPASALHPSNHNRASAYSVAHMDRFSKI